MNLAFRGISLRQVVADDMPFLFGLFTDPCRSHLWLRGRRVYDETGFRDAWAAWTSHEIAANFIVESAGRAVGLVFDHDRSTEDGWTKAVTLLSESNVGHGCGVIATALLMDWLFALLPFRKIYHEVYGYNAPVRAMWRKVGLQEEGILKADRFWNGAYWDVHIFALYRDAWAAIRPRFLRERRQRDQAASADSKSLPTEAAEAGIDSLEQREECLCHV